MALITTASILSLLDPICVWASKARGTAGATTGIGIVGTNDRAYAEVLNVETAVLNLTDLNVTEALARATLDAKNNSSYTDFFLQVWAPFVQRLNSHIAREQTASITNLESYLAYYNVGAGGYNNTLMPAIWRPLYYAFTGGSYPAYYNVYTEILQGATYANALGARVFGGAFTAGATVTQTESIGGVPQAKYVSVTGGPIVITVTGTAWNAVTQTFTTGVTWTASIPTGTGTIALTPGTAPANSYITAVTNIAATGGTGTVYVEAARPSGRTLIPV